MIESWNPPQPSNSAGFEDEVVMSAVRRVTQLYGLPGPSRIPLPKFEGGYLDPSERLFWLAYGTLPQRFEGSDC